jgi:hypothetical protein
MYRTLFAACLLAAVRAKAVKTTTAQVLADTDYAVLPSTLTLVYLAPSRSWSDREHLCRLFRYPPLACPPSLWYVCNSSLCGGWNRMATTIHLACSETVLMFVTVS